MIDQVNRPAIFLSQRDYFFVAGCALVYVAAVFLVPPYINLIEPDSVGYIEFQPIRTALYPAFLYLCRVLGLDFVQITWVQTAIFGAALAYLLIAMLRAGFARWLLVLFVAALAGNVLFSSFHRSILTESLFFSGTTVVLGLWIDYFRTGRTRFLVIAGFMLGLLVGIRPAGLGLLPMQLFAVRLKHPRNLSKWMLIIALVVPIGIGAGIERLIYRAVHGGISRSTASNLLMGMAAMLVKPNMQFTGPHAKTLRALGDELYQKYAPVQRYIADAPSLGVRAQLSAAYEGEAQFQALGDKIVTAANKEGVSVGDLSSELGKQVILQNLPGYVKLFLLNQFGQWSVAAQKFPPIAHALAQYADANPAISLGGKLPYAFLHPTPSLVGAVCYPVFLVAGAVTLVLSVVFLVFLCLPALMDTREGFYLGLAAFMSTMCQGYTMFISTINEWTPRFLMAVMPQIEIVGLCLLVLLINRLKPALNRMDTAGAST
jgi:hypothetical protein